MAGLLIRVAWRYTQRMGKLGGIILLSALALSGCAAAPVTVEQVAQVQQVPNPADPSTYSATYSADEFFIAGVKLGWTGERPSNTDLVRAGESYCAGAPTEQGSNASVVAEYAEVTYCPKR